MNISNDKIAVEIDGDICEGDLARYVKNSYVLGVGKSGSYVLEGLHKVTKRPVAIKIVSKHKLKRGEVDKYRNLVGIF